MIAQLRATRWRGVALAVSIAVAAASFVLLSVVARTTDIRVRGTLASSYRSTYDILVRPRGSQPALERSRGLISNNDLGGIFGGITLAQYRRVLATLGVEVAAPVANIGFVIPYAVPEIHLGDVVNADPVQLYRISYESVAVNRPGFHRGSEGWIPPTSTGLIEA